MFKIKKVESSNEDLKILISELDHYLAICDGEEHEFYDQYNQLTYIKNFVVIYEGDKAVGCGAFKEYQPGTAEIKRMYVNSNFRNKGYASRILIYLEDWANTVGFERIILETGLQQKEAIGLYTKTGYAIIKNYGPYEGVANSVCFQKIL